MHGTDMTIITGLCAICQLAKSKGMRAGIMHGNADCQLPINSFPKPVYVCSAFYSHSGHMHAIPDKHGCILVSGALWLCGSVCNVCSSLESGKPLSPLIR